MDVTSFRYKWKDVYKLGGRSATEDQRCSLSRED